MEEAPEAQLHIIVHEAKKSSSSESSSVSINNQSTVASQPKKYKWWLLISIYALLILSGQSTAVLLGRLYFTKGGNSKWMATLVLPAGFPILIPYYFIAMFKNISSTNDTQTEPLSALTLATVYVPLGLLLVGYAYLNSFGLRYLPVSTYTLISASQLAFNSFFSFFLNKQKFTAFIINSLVLLTISSILLVFNNESADPTKVSKVKYAIGFVCTIASSAGYGLALSCTQLCLRKVLKRQTFKVIMELIIFQDLVATSGIVIGLFASGEWKSLTREMDDYQMGKVSYVMNLVWTAIAWQVFAIGTVGLIFEVSSLFSNAISVLGLPIVPVLAVFVFQDKMDGIKAISLVLAIWGFLSYVYQNYLDDCNSKVQNEKTEITDASNES